MGARRFGWQTVRRRRLTLRGVKPLERYPHQFANFSLFGAGAPRTGDGFFQVRTALKATEFQAFLDVLAATRPDTCNLLVLDNVRAHQAADLTLPSDVAVPFQPPYAPELNPCERVWLAVKDRLAWRSFDDLAARQDHLATIIEGFEPAALQSLIAYPYLTDAIHALAV